MGEMGYMVVKESGFLGRSHLVSVAYLICSDARKMICRHRPIMFLIVVATDTINHRKIVITAYS